MSMNSKKKKKNRRNGVEEGCFEKIEKMNMNTTR